ncbi:MAG: hypothetical protein M3Z66_23130 [Chloroflexota bacterium]|nr:hypothetical protein [Chloroflexota bacterium]
MKPLKVASILMIPVADALCGYGTAGAQGNSDAAQGCLHGQQTVIYDDGSSSASSGAGAGKAKIELFQNHGDCTSFFAMHKDYTFLKAVAGSKI